MIPCFRAGTLLSEAIDSVLAQTETDWELILVDNNASDETKEVIGRYVERFPEKIRSVHEPDPGVCSARNRGIHEALGRYIALLDDDDLMYPNRLLVQKKAMDSRNDAVLCYGNIDKVSFDIRTTIEHEAMPSYFSFFKASSHLLQEKYNLLFPDPLPSSIMFKKVVAQQAGGFDRHFNPCFLEETEFYFRLFQFGSFIKLDDTVTRFRMPSEEFLKKKRIEVLKKYRLLLNQDYFYSKIRKFLKERNLLENPYVKNDLRRMKARWLREASFDFLAIPGGERYARILLQRAIREAPMDLKSFKHWMRSFAPLSERMRRYRSQQVYEEAIPREITEEFLRSLFNGDHACSYCRTENEGSDSRTNVLQGQLLP